jgi:cytochrome c
MKSIVVSALMVAAVAAQGSALASEELAKKNGCTACHGVDKKIVGPAYKDVAAKYKGDPNAALRLLSKHVREGSKGVWGQVPMPPQKAISDADLKAVLTWVLKL